MADYGIKISNPTKDISSTNVRDFALHSDYGTIKIVGTFSGSVNVPASSDAQVEINHNLPFIPVVVFWTRQSASNWWMGAIERSTLDTDSNIWVRKAISGGGDLTNSYVDATKFRLDLANKSAGDITTYYKGFFLGGDESGDIASLLTDDYGAKVSKDGADVSSTDIGDLLLHSNLTMFKYHSDQTNNLTIAAGDLTGSITFAHNLGYNPAFIAYVKYWVDNYQRILPFGRAANPIIMNACCNTTNIVIDVRQISQVVDRTYQFRVITFKDELPS